MDVNCKLLILPEGITDYSQIFLGMRVKPTFLISDVARLFAQNIEKQVPGLLGEFMGLIGDPGDTKLVEDIGLGKKISLHVTATQDTFDLQSHTDMKPHPLTGQVLNYFLYDRFHQFNHKESDHILRLIDNVHELKGAINSQVVEQQNNIMSRCKDFLNKMTLDLHYIIILYIMLTRNIKLNDKYIDSVRKDAQFAGKQLSLDQFGRLVIGEGGSSNIRQVSDATYQYIPKPPLESLDPLKISWLNSILYVIFYSDIFQEVLKNKDKIGHIYTKAFELFENKYDRNEHLKISQSFHEELIKIHGDWSEKDEQDVIKVMKYLFIHFLHDLGISASQMQFSDNFSMKQNMQEHLSCHRGSTDEALLPEFVILYNDANILDLDFGNDLCEMTVCFELFSAKYLLTAFIVSKDDVYVTYVNLRGNLFSISHTHAEKVSSNHFVEAGKSAYILFFQLKTIKQNMIQRNLSKPKTAETATGVNTPILKRKVCEIIDSSKSKVAKLIESSPQLWMDYGHTKLYKFHQDWLKSKHEKYDDVIIDLMCKIIQKDCNSANPFQSTCLSSNLKGPPFKPVLKSRFTQVMLRNNDHFVVLSNAFTDNIGHIQVFDSNAHNYLPSISSGPFLNPKNDVAKAIKSLQPKAWIVSFMDCMQQTDSSSCGPLALLNFWSLISGIPPHHVKYSTEVPHLRESTRNNSFKKVATVAKN